MKICTIDTINNSIINSGIYFDISSSVLNSIGTNVTVLNCSKNNFSDFKCVLRVTPTNFLDTISFELNLPVFINFSTSYFLPLKHSGYTETDFLPINDIVAYCIQGTSKIKVSMTSRDSAYSSYIIKLHS